MLGLGVNEVFFFSEESQKPAYILGDTSSPGGWTRWSPNLNHFVIHNICAWKNFLSLLPKISVIFCIELKNLSVREKQIMFITSSLKVSFSEKACWGILILSPLYVYGLLLGIVEEWRMQSWFDILLAQTQWFYFEYSKWLDRVIPCSMKYNILSV